MKRCFRPNLRIFLLSVFTLLLIGSALTQAETIVDVKLPDGFPPVDSDSFIIYRKMDDGTAKGDTEVYARMVLPYFTSLGLQMEMPLSEQATISWDLLQSDKKTLMLSNDQLEMTNGYTNLWLFRGTLPPGTYYLRLYDFGRGCSDESKDALKTHLTTYHAQYRTSLKEDDLAGTNNTRETAAVLPSGYHEGYLSIQGSDPQDWYTFDAGKAGATLTVYHTPYSDDFEFVNVSHDLYRKDGSTYTKIGSVGAYSDTDYELEPGTYYLCMNCGYYEGEAIAPPLRGGAYALSLTQKEVQTEAPEPEKPAAKTTLKKGSVKKVSGQSYTITKVAKTGSKGTVSLHTASNKKSVTVPASVKIGGNTYTVTAVEAKAFTGSKIRTVIIGANVKALNKNSFYKSKASRIILKTKKLARKNVKYCLKGSVVKTIQVKVGTKKQNKAYMKKYKKWFTKAYAGRKVAFL